MIDLHTHTDESDGTLTPKELLAEAARVGLEALAITDHDTFAGYDEAAAIGSGMDLVCGIELSTRHEGRPVHLLGYFLKNDATAEFRAWVTGLIASRQQRNRELIDKLRGAGVRISLEEVSARGRGMIGRPHFAAVMMEKGYVTSTQQAFDDYLGECGSCFTARDEVDFAEAAGRIAAAGGVPVLAHPGRILADPAGFAECLERMRRAGLRGLEAFHSEQSPEQRAAWAALARRLSLAVTGGSDFHGAAKPGIALGTGIGGTLNIPRTVLEELRRVA